jgi:hypothetical protein
MTALTKVALAFVVFLLLGIAAQTWRLTGAQNALALAQLQPAHQAAVAAAARVETVTVKLAGSEKIVTHYLTQKPTEPLVLVPVTPADTAKAAAQLPGVAAALDTLKRACSVFVADCQSYRLAAENRFAADSTEITGLRRAFNQEQPSRFGAAWGAVKTPLVFLAGTYVGFKILR